jgi:SAM-dependent methyltransferase
MSTPDAEEIRDAVRDRYAQAARVVGTEVCAAARASEGLIGVSLYADADAEVLPDAALQASLGCGNPTILADLQPGETVLDLGSGGGIDVLLSARRVAPTGKAYGLDMTAEMLELARRNQAEAGVTNAEFLEGTMENIPLPDESVDVIISNCVVNLSPDKAAVIHEAFRVLKPGGRLAIADIVLHRSLPDALQQAMGAWTGCIAGALVGSDYADLLHRAGFEQVSIEATHTYDRADIAGMAGDAHTVLAELGDSDRQATLAELDGAAMSAFIRAGKPAPPTTL